MARKLRTRPREFNGVQETPATKLLSAGDSSSGASSAAPVLEGVESRDGVACARVGPACGEAGSGLATLPLLLGGLNVTSESEDGPPVCSGAW